MLTIGNKFPDFSVKGVVSTNPANAFADFTQASDQGKWNGDDSHDERDDRVGELAVKLYAQAHGIKAALPQVVDVAGELGVRHLLRLADHFCEVAGLFVYLREC